MLNKVISFLTVVGWYNKLEENIKKRGGKKNPKINIEFILKLKSDIMPKLISP
jgi:hypothetical protein